MNFRLVLIGKTDEPWLKQGIEEYLKRLKHYISFDIIELAQIKNSKNIEQAVLKKKEGELILNSLTPSDIVVLLDEKGKLFTSTELSAQVQQFLNTGQKRLVFVVGGAFGFSDEVYERANMKLSLSKMTFSHQMVRLIFVEQLYRAMTILKGEKYHHE
jgi:23S rRNA (pseudouridine1915-N3)-methyltransferase